MVLFVGFVVCDLACVAVFFVDVFGYVHGLSLYTYNDVLIYKCIYFCVVCVCVVVFLFQFKSFCCYVKNFKCLYTNNFLGI